MAENNSKWNNWWRINFQNIQAALTTQYQENKQPCQKLGIRPKQHFSKKDIQIAKKYIRKSSTSLIIREMQIKTTMRYHFTPVRITIIKSVQTIKFGESVEKREHSCRFGGNVNWYSHYGRWYGDSLKTRNKTIIWPRNLTPRHIHWGNQNWKTHVSDFSLQHYL